MSFKELLRFGRGNKGLEAHDEDLQLMNVEVVENDFSGLEAVEDIKKMSRRSFLGIFAGTVAGVGLAANGLLSGDSRANQNPEGESDENLQLTPSENDPDVQEIKKMLENEKGLSSALDITTLSLVCASFARHVLYGGAVKGVELNLKGAAEIGALAIARIFALSQFGNEEGKELAKLELAEIQHGLEPLPLLVLLSDITTTSLHVNLEEILKRSQEKYQPLDMKKDRPQWIDAFESDEARLEYVKEWQEYLNKVEENMALKAGEIAGITAILAPLGTTYTSSSLSNDMKEDILNLLFEQSIAQKMVSNNMKKLGLSRDTIEVKALVRADKLFNGTYGFSKLMMTLSANTQGAFGIGDPPEIYFMMEYLGKNPGSVALTHAAGFIASGLYTTSLNALWLKKVGLKNIHFTKTFFSAQEDTMKAIGKTVGNGDLRNISFSSGRKFKNELLESLNADENASEKTVELLKNMPEVMFAFDFKSYLKNKMDILKEKRVDPKVLHKIKKYGHADIGSLGIEDFVEMLEGTKDSKHLKYKLDGILALRQDVEADYLATTLKEMVSKMDNLKLKVEEEKDTEKIEGVRKQLQMEGQKLDKHVARIRDVIQPIKTKFSGDPSPEEMKNYYHQLTEGLKISPEQFLAKYTGRKQSDAVPGEKSHDEDLSVESAIKEDEEMGVYEKPHFLSHAAWETLCALSNQIPAVPSIARLVKLLLPKLAVVENKENVTEQELRRLVMILIPIISACSGVADNVAAYMLGKDVMISFFKAAFGKDIFEKNTTLEVQLAAVAKLVAEQSGSLTKIGNGPNFSQQKLKLRKVSNDSRDYVIDRENIEMSETLPHQNVYSTIANTTTWIAAMGYLEILINTAASGDNNKKTVDNSR